MLKAVVLEILAPSRSFLTARQSIGQTVCCHIGAATGAATGTGSPTGCAQVLGTGSAVGYALTPYGRIFYVNEFDMHVERCATNGP